LVSWRCACRCEDGRLAPFTKIEKLLKFLAETPQILRKPLPLFIPLLGLVGFYPALILLSYPPVGTVGPGPRLAGDLALT